MLLIQLVVGILLIQVVQSRYLQESNGKCCATCLKGPNMKGADALNFEKCRVAEGGGCCFDTECKPASLGEPAEYSETIDFKAEIPQVKMGTWIQVRWPHAEDVKFIIIREGQAKNTQPKNESEAAHHDQGWFQFCASNVGTAYYRGFKDFGCSASLERSIQIVKGEEGASCGSKPNSDTFKKTADGECNLNRASVIDGQCVCTSDWAGAPECNNLPVWKWAVSIGGGIAALVSIVVSVHAFLQRRKRNYRDSILSPQKARSPKSPVMPYTHYPSQTANHGNTANGQVPYVPQRGNKQNSQPPKRGGRGHHEPPSQYELTL